MTLSRTAVFTLVLSLLAACGAGPESSLPAPAEATAAASRSAARGKSATGPTHVFSGKLSDYTVVHSAAGVVVTEKAGAKALLTLPGAYKLLFADQAVVFDPAGPSGKAYRLYQAAFDRAPDVTGLGFHIAVLQYSDNPSFVAQGFVDSAEFKARYGALDNAAFLTQLYRNILHRAPDEAGLIYWLNLLDRTLVNRGQALAGFSESPENTALVAPAIANGIAYVPYIVPGTGSASALAPAAFSWNVLTNTSVVLRDARGQEVLGALSCAMATQGTLEVAADCSKLSGKQLGPQNVLVSGGGVTAIMKVNIIPQRQAFGTQGSSGSGSGDYNVLVTAGGNVAAWGANHSLVLGQGAAFASTSSLPVLVKDTAGTGVLGSIVSASAGEADAMALTDQGLALVWGELHSFARSGPKDLPSLVRNPANDAPLSNLVQLSVGASNAVALDHFGRVFTWGRYSGQGVESEIKFPNQPKNPDGSGALGGVVQVAAGFDHTLALGANGKVYAWGWNSYGETGRGTAQTQEVLPAMVKLEADGSELQNIVQVVAGYHFSLALSADGKVYAWGKNDYEQLGLGKAHGQHYRAELVKDVGGIHPLTNIVMLAAGHNYALALQADARVLSWGFAADGRLGDGVNGNRSFNGRPMPVVGADGLGELTDVVSIAAGPGHALAVLADGSVMTWGDGYGAALGQGGADYSDRRLPVPVKNIGGTGKLMLTLSAYPNLLNRGR